MRQKKYQWIVWWILASTVLYIAFPSDGVMRSYYYHLSGVHTLFRVTDACIFLAILILAFSKKNNWAIGILIFLLVLTWIPFTLNFLLKFFSPG